MISQSHPIFFFTSLLFVFIFLTTLFCYWILKSYGNPLPRLFHEFDKKIWMTFGLGLIFFGFYFFAVTTLAWIIDGESLQKVFAFIYIYKVASIYIGLSTFAFITLTIYLVRLFIKYLYKNHRKNF